MKKIICILLFLIAGCYCPERIEQTPIIKKEHKEFDSSSKLLLEFELGRNNSDTLSNIKGISELIHINSLNNCLIEIQINSIKQLDLLIFYSLDGEYFKEFEYKKIMQPVDIFYYMIPTGMYLIFELSTKQTNPFRITGIVKIYEYKYEINLN